MFLFPPGLVSETSLNLRKIRRDTIIIGARLGAVVSRTALQAGGRGFDSR
jgi:hypothetical protein